jgi:hypothetical protein
VPKRGSATWHNLGINELLAQLQMSKTPNAVLKDEYLKTDGLLAAITKTFTAYETRTSAVPVGACRRLRGLKRHGQQVPGEKQQQQMQFLWRNRTAKEDLLVRQPV